MSKISKKFWKNKRVLVTGHEGFLGSWLTKTLVRLGANVTGVDIVTNRPISMLNGERKKIKVIKGNITNRKFIQRVFKTVKPQFVFHLAAEAIVGVANKNPVRTFESNIEGTWNILEQARGRRSVEAIVVASSDKAYGIHKKLPYTEEAALQGDHPYDASKSCADLLCNTYAKSFGVPVAITRCGNIYGPGDFNFSRLVPDAICHTLRNKQFTIRSNGKFTRDYIYVTDIVEGYLLLAQKLKYKKLGGEAFNFSCEKPFSVLEVFNQIVNNCGTKRIKPKILNQASMEIPHQYLTSKKAKRVLGWKARHTLKQGLLESIKWYGEHAL